MISPARWFAKQYADLHGYFWLPCPRCGEYFGGHETGGGTYIYEIAYRPDGTPCGSSGKILCPNCPGEYYAEAVGPVYAGSLPKDW